MHNGCVLCGGVGVGKSHTAVGYYLNNEAPKPVYVITTAKKRNSGDWQAIWATVGMHKDPDLTMGAVVIVDSWEKIHHYEDVKDAFFIFDEQRLVGSGRWVKAFYKIAQANRWIMLSATPGDNWLDYVPLFRANGFIKNLTQFKEDHVVSRWTGRYYQVTGYRQVGRLVRWRNSLLVEMPYERHTTRHSHVVPVMFDKELVQELVKKRWHVYENRPLTDASELFRVMRKVVYTDETRLEAVRSLLTTHPKLIVFYNFDYELEILRTLNIPQTQIMKTPESIVPLGPSRTSISTECISASTQSPTHSESGSTSLEDQSRESSEPETLWTSDTGSEASHPTINDDSWEYLLSPEGLRANDLTGANGALGPRTEHGLTSTSSVEDGDVWTAPKVGLEGAMDHPETHPSAQEYAEKDAIPGGQDRTSQQSSETSKHSPNADGPFETSTESVHQNGFDTVSSAQQKVFDTSRSNSSETTDRRELADSTKEIECLKTKTPGDSNPGTNETTSIRSEPETTTSKLADPIWTNEASTRTNTQRKSSGKSKRLSDLSPTGSASTPTPQFQVAEWNGHKHEDVPTTTSWVYLVQYVAGAEAWECVETDAMCFFSMPYSWKKWDQAHGRIDRLHTSFLDLHYYVLMSEAPIDRGVAKSLASQKTFNESAFAAEMGFNT